MNSRWIAFLQSHGAVIGTGSVAGFGETPQELLAGRDGSVVAPLTHLGMLAVTGDDARDFLHAQLSSDVKALAPNQAQYSAYCSPKGRVLANFLLSRDATGLHALLSRELAESVRKRLSMFVLRSKVKIEDTTAASAILGLSGPAAAAAIERVFGAAPGNAFQVVATDAGSVLNLGDGRYVAVMSSEQAEPAWGALCATLTPVGEPVWRWLDIRSGVAWITAATQDQFVPQMANLDLIGAVNFQKGCYPGQEIVARTQYLGKLKRRAFRLHADVGQPPAPAASLYSDELGEQACGMVVDAAPAPEGGCDLLAVLQSDAALASPLHLGSPAGPVLSLLALPYQVPQAA